jgi:hypothetical protein
MKVRLLLLLFVTILSSTTFGQLNVVKENGGSVVTKLGMGVRVNDGSTLQRDFYTINSAECPLQLQGAGIKLNYSTRFTFAPVGKVIPNEKITAYEVHHVLYNIFGEHMMTLSNIVVTDIAGPTDLNQYASWYARESSVAEYFICISYVANVRTANGAIWHYNFKAIQAELEKLKLKFEEADLPTENKKGGE